LLSGRGPHLIARIEKILDYQVDSGLVDDAPLLGVLAVECRRESRDNDELEGLRFQVQGLELISGSGFSVFLFSVDDLGLGVWYDRLHSLCTKIEGFGLRVFRWA